MATKKYIELKEFKDLTPEIEKRILNASSFPTYLELIKQSKFTKTIKPVSFYFFRKTAENGQF